jgi:predicted dithiol-disulfide oxidoreductase (DUF899 family)
MTDRDDRPLHDVRFPGEPDEYRRVRDALLRAEVDLRRGGEAVAALRRELPRGGEVPSDYAFQEWDARSDAPRTVLLSELFGDKDTLFLYSFMFLPDEAGHPLGVACSRCTSIIDGVDGAVPHLTQQISFAAAAKAPIDQFRAHGRTRGWRHARLLSSSDSTYNSDYQAEGPDGSQFPIATVFTRHDGRINHFWSSELWMVPSEPGQNPRHVDFMWPIWAMLDRTAEGRGTDWAPALDYSRDDQG